MARSGRTGNLRRWRRRAVAGLLLAIVAGNGIACMQARALLVYAASGAGTRPIEQLGWPEKLRLLVLGARVPRPANHLTPLSVGLAFETGAIELESGARLELWIVPAAGREAPRGVAALFHGYAASKESLLAPAVDFAARGFTVLLVDFQGSGGSSGSDTTVGVREADDVAAALAYARQRWPGQRLIAYGFSMGAVALLRAAAVHGAQPDALILEAPFDRMLGAIRQRFAAMGLPAFPAAELILGWASVQRGFNGFAHNPESYASSVTAPALLVHGAADPRVPASQVAAVAAQLAGPHRVAELAGVGHETASSAAPGLWAAELDAFLASLPEQGIGGRRER